MAISQVTFDQMHSHRPYVLILFRMWGYAHVAEDLTQEVMIKAWLHHADLEDDNIKGWLRVTAKRVLLDHIRDNGRRPDMVLVDDWGTWDRPSDDIEDHSRWLALLNVISGLTAVHRETFYRLYVKGMNPIDVARQEGVSIDTMTVRHHRLKAQLRRRGEEVLAALT